MSPFAKICLLLGSINAALVISLGAFGAHALKHRLTAALMAVYQTGIQYHLLHALGLLLIGCVALYSGGNLLLKWSAALMLAGILLFSGSLYALAVTGLRWLGAITPLGGIAYIAAWVAFAIAVWRAD